MAMSFMRSFSLTMQSVEPYEYEWYFGMAPRALSDGFRSNNALNARPPAGTVLHL